MTPYEVQRVVHALETFADAGLGFAMMGGAVLLAKRSINAASYVALAGFFQVGGAFAQTAEVFFYRYTTNIWAIGRLVDAVTLAGVFGALIVAVRAVPSSTHPPQAGRREHPTSRSL